MEFDCSSTVGAVGFFGAVEVTKITVLAVDRYAGVPLSRWAPTYPLQATSIVLLGTSVVQVFGVRCRSQVQYRIVHAIPINVVDLLGWPIAMHEQPGYAMG